MSEWPRERPSERAREGAIDGSSDQLQPVPVSQFPSTEQPATSQMLTVDLRKQASI